jgi:replicative DNA helicase
MNLPSNTDAERYVLGSILLDGTFYVEASATLKAEDFSIEKHRRIWSQMGVVHGRGETIDRITVANALMAAGELESVDGLSYIVSLDDGLPQIPNAGDYARIVKDDSVRRSIIFACQKLATRAQLREEQPAEILAGANRTLLELAEGCSVTSLVTPAQVIEAGGGIGAYIDRRNKITGLSWGYPALDVMTGGLQAGRLYILAARPKMGKSALAMNVVERVTVAGEQTALVFSLEMSKEELVDRLICSRAKINTQRFSGGYLNEDEKARAWKAAGEICVDDRILIDDKANVTTQEIHSKVRKQLARGPVGLVVLDYLQLLLNCKPSERVAMMSQITRDCKLIAKDCKVPFIALSQLSRACELRGSPTNLDGYRPVPSDLRESGSAEQDADVVMSIFRGEVYAKDRDDLKGLADVEVLLQRGGPTGIVPFVWLGEYVRFEERAK